MLPYQGKNTRAIKKLATEKLKGKKVKMEIAY